MPRYESPEAFRQAVEQRLRSDAGSGAEFNRRRQFLVFDRFLARMGETMKDSVILKGGVALELRLTRSRSTKDVDLRFSGPPERLLEQMKRAADLDLGDWMRFGITPDEEWPGAWAEAVRFEGLRFRAECSIAGKTFGQPFGVDVAIDEPIFGEPVARQAEDLLGFAGVRPPTILLYPIETHIAEKLHAYTMPRARPNTRVKDLPDLALLGTIQPLEAGRLRSAIRLSFEFRGTHAVPERLPDPPTAWSFPYAQMANEDQLPWANLAQVTKAAADYLDPLLAGAAIKAWDPRQRAWTPG